MSKLEKIVSKINPLGFLKKAVTYTLIAGAVVFGGKVVAQDAVIEISGSGYANPGGNHPSTMVYAKEVVAPGDTMTLDSVLTDVNGDYSFSFVMTGLQNEVLKNNGGLRTLGNPYNEEARIQVNVNYAGNYNLCVFDVSGKQLLKTQVRLDKGENLVNVSGLGVEGVKVLYVMGEKENYSTKLVQLGNSNNDPNVKVTRTDNPLLKQSALLADSVILQFKPVQSNYEGMQTTVVAESQIVNYLLEEIPQIIEFTMNTYTLNGDPANQNTAVKINWSDGPITYVANSGQIHVVKEDFEPHEDVVTMENADTTIHSLWLFGLKIQDYVNCSETNLFQSSKVPSSFDNYIPPGPATVTLANLPSVFDLYFQVKEVEDPINPGQMIRTDSFTFRKITSSASPGTTMRYEHIPSITDTIDIYQPTWDNSYPTQQISLADLDAAKVLLDSVMTLFYRNNGKQVFPPWTFSRITSTSDPKYIELQARNFDQTAKTQFRSIGNPGNGSAPENSVLVPGAKRIKSSYSMYPVVSTDGQRFEEMFQKLGNFDDPPTGGLAGYVCNPDFSPTRFAEELFFLVYTANSGTPLN